MKERIRQLMEAQHMNQQTFAKFTNISSASLSSIFTGRTRPTMNHVLAIMSSFPNVNPIWLLKGEGGMMLTDTATSHTENENSTLFDAIEDAAVEGTSSNINDGGNTDKVAVDMPLFDTVSKPYSVHPSVLPPVSSRNSGGKYSKTGGISGIHPVSTGSEVRKITEIRVFFDDQTWESFVPKNK
jgi:transcriptional regulator with XRE-family HTH domain